MNAMTDDNEGISRSVFDIITGDHRTVMGLFEEIQWSVGQTRIRLIEKCIQELMLHAIAEEETLYRKLRVSDDFRQAIVEAEVEHGLIERLANEIISSSPEDELCDARLTVLRVIVRRHMVRVEDHLLPAARLAIDKATAESLGQEMTARKAALAEEGSDVYYGQLLDDDDTRRDLVGSTGP